LRRDAPEAYVRRVIVTSYLTGRRRRWLGEQSVAVLPETASHDDPFEQVDTRTTLQRVLRDLPDRQRAVIVLRYYDDMTEAAAAALLDCSVGTIKSQTSKAMATLRSDPRIRDLLESENSHE
jgi:RNA polymerase sigma factor (sigma-70 family)